MVAFRVWISLEKDTYQPGEELRGEVTLSVVEPFPCDGISVVLEWYVDAKEAIYGQQVKAQELPNPRQLGEHRLPFVFRVPIGPFAYQGVLFSVKWRVRVLVKIPWAEDHSKGVSFRVSPAPGMSSAERYFCGPSYKPTKRANDKDLLSSALLRLSEGKLGKPKVSLSKQLVCRGDTIGVRLSFSAQRDLSFGQTCIELRSSERANAEHELVFQSRAELVVEDEVLALDPYRGGPAQEQAPRQVRSGASCSLRASLWIPEEAPFTFVAPSYAVESRVHLHLEILGWPDWSLDFPVTIRPGKLLAPSDG